MPTMDTFTSNRKSSCVPNLPGLLNSPFFSNTEALDHTPLPDYCTYTASIDAERNNKKKKD